MTDYQREVLLKYCKFLGNSLQKQLLNPQQILDVVSNNSNDHEKIIDAIIYLNQMGYLKCNMNSLHGSQVPSTLKLTPKAIDFAN